MRHLLPMDAAQYLQELTAELLFTLSQQRVLLPQDAKARLIGAVRALEALDLLSRSDGQLVLEAFDRTLQDRGFIERIEEQQVESKHLVATAISSRPHRDESQTVLPWLVDVVALGVEVNLDEPHATYLLYLTSWSHFAELVVGVVGDDRGVRVDRQSPGRHKLGPDIEWTIWDDRGTRYQVGGGGSGGTSLMTFRYKLAPRIPASAKKITVAALSSLSGQSDTHTFDL